MLHDRGNQLTARHFFLAQPPLSSLSCSSVDRRPATEPVGGGLGLGLGLGLLSPMPPTSTSSSAASARPASAVLYLWAFRGEIRQERSVLTHACMWYVCACT